VSAGWLEKSHTEGERSVRERDEEKIFFFLDLSHFFYTENYRFFELGFLVMHNGSTIRTTHFIFWTTN
jgi:hypothetical protein